MAVVVSGFRELSRAFGKVEKQFSKDLRAKLREAAEPVRADASRLAGASIRNLGEGDPWTGMKVGGGVTVVYVAPKKRRSKDAKRRRSSFGDALMDRAMSPALVRNTDQVMRKADQALEDMERDWGAGG